MNYEELEKKVFDFKFPFGMIANVILFLQKIQQMHPDKSNAVNKASTQCIDEIVDQLSDEDLRQVGISSPFCQGCSSLGYRSRKTE